MNDKDRAFMRKIDMAINDIEIALESIREALLPPVVDKPVGEDELWEQMGVGKR